MISKRQEQSQIDRHKPMFWVLGRILITQHFSNVRQPLMLPTDKDISRASISIDYPLDTGKIISLDRRVYSQTQVLC
jgi:hypothetical protein